MEENNTTFKTLFEDKLQCLIANKKANTQILSREAFYAMIKNIKEVRNKKTGKTPVDYARMRKYDVIVEGDEEKLVVPNTGNKVVYFVHTDEIFNILHEMHLKTNHGKRLRMTKELSVYKNITREMIELFLSLCNECLKQNSVNDRRNSRQTISFLSFMQMSEHDRYRHVLIHENLPTKFIQLRPLKTMDFNEIAGVLLEIYTIFGPSNFLMTQFGTEFSRNVIAALKAQWCDLNIEIMEEREEMELFPEKTIELIKTLLCTRLNSNQAKSWVQELKFVQLVKNKTKDDLHGCAFDAMFGNNRTTKQNVNFDISLQHARKPVSEDDERERETEKYNVKRVKKELITENNAPDTDYEICVLSEDFVKTETRVQLEFSPKREKFE